MLKKIIIAGAATLLVLANSAQIGWPPEPRLLYNPSKSAPIGWYKINRKTQIQRGDKVAAYAPDWARKLADERHYLPYDYPLIKTVWAVSGEEICSSNGWVTVPNRPHLPVLVRDGLGRDMPVHEGCYTLNDNEVFLVSTDVQTSWDSRYFGPVNRDHILGTVTYLGGGRFGNRRNPEK